MNKKYDVKVHDEFGKPSLSVTHNGCQWASLRIEDPLMEIPKMIAALTVYLLQHQSTGNGEGCADNEKTLDAAVDFIMDTDFGGE